MKSALSVLLLCFLLASCGEEKSVEAEEEIRANESTSRFLPTFLEKKSVEAEVAIRERAEQGDADAQSKLGWMYSNGDGVPKDYTEAVKWYRKAAEQGDAISQNNLGGLYDNGQGVLQDYTEAVKWYRKAAEAGQADAQSNLGVKYALGKGVPKDDVKAYMFFNLASVSFDGARKNRDLVSKRMTKEQIAESQKLTREWVARWKARKAKENGE